MRIEHETQIRREPCMVTYSFFPRRKGVCALSYSYDGNYIFLWE